MIYWNKRSPWLFLRLRSDGRYDLWNTSQDVFGLIRDDYYRLSHGESYVLLV